MTDLYEFDSQTKFRDSIRARHGLPWEEVELKELKRLYMQGDTLQAICDLMERPKEGVLPKLANLGLITKQSNGFFCIWRRRVLPDAWKVNAKPAKPNSGPLKTYPYLETFADDLENSGFKGVISGAAISGVATSPDLSGLGICTVSTGRTTSSQPNLQTKPKEPTMKFETRTFINDQDASTLTDDQIFGEIRRAENRIEELKAIKVQSGKLAKAIDDLQDYVNKLAAYLDAR